MAAPEHLPGTHRAVWDEVVSRAGASVEGPALEAFVGQIATMREAQRRVSEEGMVVSDPKGNPVPHPGIAVAKAAQAEIRAWGDRFERPLY